MNNRNNKLLGISGKKRSGKNTVAKLINDILWKEKGLIYDEKAFAYLVKKFASMLTDIPEEGWETETDKDKELGKEWYTFDSYGLKVPMTRRRFLQKLGSDACNQNLHPNCWVNGLFQNYTEDSKWIITDVRFPQEVAALNERGGYTIRVIRPGIDNATDQHVSETALDNYKQFDIIIINDGDMVALEEKVRAALFKLKLI